MTNNKDNGKLNYKAREKTPTLYEVLMLYGFKHEDAITYIDNTDKMCAGMEEVGCLVHDFNGGVTQGGWTGE